VKNTYLKYTEEMAVTAAIRTFTVSEDGLVIRD